MIRAHAAHVITKRQLFETLISPGYYLALSAGLILGFFLITGFVKSIDSSGFNYQLNPLYDLIGRSFEGAFGKTFVEQLFAEGPFLFALYISFSPILLFLSINSVFRFGLEKKVGAIELLAYGPSDGTAYFIASIMKDIIMTILTLSVLTIFLGTAALLNNLVFGPSFLYSLLVVFFLSLSIYGYGILASTLTESSASAITLFIGIMAFFLLLMMGSFTIISQYVQNLTSFFSCVIQWFSPLFYWNLGLQAIEADKAAFFVISLLFLLFLTTVTLFLSHVTLRIKGVRP